MQIDELRKYCLSFPGAEESIKWSDHLTFVVGEKMFLSTSMDTLAHGLSLKCTPETFSEMIEREDIAPAAYVGRYKWIRISDLRAVSTSELKSLIAASYKLVFDKLPPKIKKAIV